jgi:signal transduction histidine kinase
LASTRLIKALGNLSAASLVLAHAILPHGKIKQNRHITKPVIPTALMSDQFKHAFKVALAMVIAYGIALGMGWEKPFWAGFAVAFCSLATAGESIDHGMQRIAGTLLAGLATIVMVALFPQDRWPFLLAMSGFIALCTYLVSGVSRYNYLWFNAGFNVPILAMLGDNLAINSFETIILRAQETALGVVVYSLVAVLVWPRRGAVDFEQSVKTTCADLQQLFSRYLGIAQGIPDDDTAEQLRTRLNGQLSRLDDQLGGAVYDSGEIWQSVRAWKRCIRELKELSQTMERWRLGLDTLGKLDLQRLLPGHADYASGLEARLAAIQGMLAGQDPAQQPQPAMLKLDPEAMRGLSHFQRSAVLKYRDQLAGIDHLSQDLFATVSAIRGHGKVDRLVRTRQPMSSPWVPDPDRLAATIRQTTTLWLTMLAVIYLPAFPNPVGVIALANAFAMVFAMVPQVPAGVLLLPTILGAVFAGSLYIFLMPHLSGFSELGAMIFVATFLISYMFHQPKAVLAKSMGLCMLVIMIGVENEQTYSFLFVSNWFIGAVFFILAMMLAWRLPVSFRPRDRFLAMMTRFFRSTDFLLSDAGTDVNSKPSWLMRWRSAFHRKEISVLPKRLRAWGGALPPDQLGEGGRESLQSLLGTLQVLSDHLLMLLEARSSPRTGGLMQELSHDMRNFSTSVRSGVEYLSDAPEKLDHAVAVSRLEASFARLELRVTKVLDEASEADLSSRDGESLYRLLDAQHGVTKTLSELAGKVSTINWSRLREARF